MFLAVFAAIFAIFLIFVNFWKFRSQFKSIPAAPGQIPLFGMAHKFIGADIKDFGRIFLDTLDTKLPIQKVRLGTKVIVFPNTPQMFKTILTSPDCMDKPAFLYDAVFSKFGLLASNGSIQERHRRILNHSMTLSMLQQLIPVFERSITKYVERIDEKAGGAEFDAFDDVAACTLEALLKGNFRFDYDCYDSELLKACQM
jgi:cytochrome P450